MPTFDLICLANSNKHSGRCVAGLRVDGSGWVRPVSAQSDGTLFQTDYLLSDMTEVGPLEVFRFNSLGARPVAHQPENWVIDATRWQLLARPMNDQLLPVLQNRLVLGPELLSGTTDRIACSHIQQRPLASSLALVAPETLDLFQKASYSGKSAVRGRFSLGQIGNAQTYELSVTDPIWISNVSNRGSRVLRQTDMRFLLTVSLSEPFRSQCYKLIAAIIPLPPPLAAKF